MANKFKVSLLVNLRDMFYTFAQNEKRYGIFPDRNIRINNICDISMYEDHEFRGCYRILRSNGSMLPSL